jgi:hypothetical protein
MAKPRTDEQFFPNKFILSCVRQTISKSIFWGSRRRWARGEGVAPPSIFFKVEVPHELGIVFCFRQPIILHYRTFLKMTLTILCEKYAPTSSMTHLHLSRKTCSSVGGTVVYGLNSLLASRAANQITAFAIAE